MSFLDDICTLSHQRYREALAQRPLSTVVAATRDMPVPPRLRLDSAGFDLIAEVKRASPSLGELSGAAGAGLIDRALAYAHAGAAAVSVLTEPSRFGGQLEHLRIIATALRPLGVPVMRKDFFVNAYQVWEAAAAGAGGVLLIVRVLDDSTIMEMLEAAAQTRMFVLLEAFDREDLQRAQPFATTNRHVLVGLNARDLATLEVDTGRLQRLAGNFPANCPKVAESGIASADDAARLSRAGYELALVGTALMREADPGQLLSDMLAAGRGVA